MDMTARDLVGYGANRPEGRWPNGARLAVSVVVNYEEGSERSHAMRDADQESMTEFGSYAFPANVRNLAMESMYEYGSRVGVWRILESLRDAGRPRSSHAPSPSSKIRKSPAPSWPKATRSAAMAIDGKRCSA
jgi:hypothetical protein